MSRHHLSLYFAVGAALLSVPTLIDILFAITFIHDDLNSVFMAGLILSFVMAISSVVMALLKSKGQATSVLLTIAIAAIPFVVVGLGTLPIAGSLRPLVGLAPLR